MTNDATDASKVFEGKYEVLGKIKEGGMGAVYRVRHRLLNQVRVIKVMLPGIAESQDSQRRFLREAQTVTRLNHPNIVTFYDYAIDAQQTAFIVMEHIDGVGLSDLLRTRGPLPLGLAGHVAECVLSALAYLHRKEIVHRDLSPDNIMIGRDEGEGVCVKLIDLGIAKISRAEEERLTQRGEFFGKLFYASPEQLNRGAGDPGIDGRSDLYSFGVVLYELLTGVCPFRGGSLGELLRAHSTGDIVPFEESDPGSRLSLQLRAVLVRALDPRPDARFGTADAFAEALSRALGSCRRCEAGLWDEYLGPALARPESVVNQGPHAALQKQIDGEFPATKARRPELTEKERAASFGGVAGTGGGGGASPRGVARTVLEVPDLGDGVLAGAFSGPVLDPTRVYDGTLVYRPAPAARKDRRALFLWGAGIGLAVSVGVGVFLYSRPGEDEPPSMLVPFERLETVATPEPVVAPTPFFDPAAVPLPSDPPGARTEPVSPMPRPQPAVAGASVVLPGPSLSRESSVLSRTRYCAYFDRTSYVQATVKEKPEGFAPTSAEVFVGARPDAGRVLIEVEVRPAEPVEGEPVEIVARIVNGGDVPLQVARVEEFHPREGFASVPGSPVPIEVDVGGSAEVFRERRVLGRGSAYAKELRVVDDDGDSWKTTIRLVACSGSG